MKTSAAGRARIREREGEVLHTYYDTQGVLTGGVGHTGRMAPPKLTPGMTITKAMSDAWLEADLGPVELALNAVLKVRVTQNQFDALASFLFNIGVGWAGVGGHQVASIFMRLNAGNVASAAEAFDFFHNPPEVTGRRNQEKAQFVTPDAAPVAGRPTPSAASPIVGNALNPAPARGTSPAPASATPATKEKTMTAAAINLGAGFANVFENLAHSIFTGGAAVQNPNVDTKTSEGNPITNFGADIADAKAAGSEILEIVGDFRAKNLTGGVDDAIDLARIVFGALDRHGVKVPIVTQAIKSIDLDPAS